MSSTDILQDVHDREQMPKVNKVRLFLVHIIAVFCTAYLGMMIVAIILMPTFASINEQLRNLKRGEDQLPSLKQINFMILGGTVTGYAFAFIGGIISYLICKKQKLPVILPLSILLYSIIIFWVANHTPYVGFLFPGTYFMKYLGLNIAPIVNVIYFLPIIWFLFFSKRVKNWWLRPVIE
jgi:hypothetical protein